MEYTSLCYAVGPYCLHIIDNSLLLLVPDSQSFPPLPHPLPFIKHKAVPYVCVSVSVFFHLFCVLDFTYKWYHVAFVFLFLTLSASYDNLWVLSAASGII